MENIQPFSNHVAPLYQRWLRKRLFSDKFGWMFSIALTGYIYFSGTNITCYLLSFAKLFVIPVHFLLTVQHRQSWHNCMRFFYRISTIWIIYKVYLYSVFSLVLNFMELFLNLAVLFSIYFLHALFYCLYIYILMSYLKAN